MTGIYVLHLFKKWPLKGTSSVVRKLENIFIYPPLPPDSEKLGHEHCFSTGDVIKVVGLKVKKILASSCETEDASVCPATVELSLDFPGTVLIFSLKEAS